MKKTPLRLKLPKEMRERLALDSFMQHCIIPDGTCEGRLEWNHAFQYAGRRRNEIWAILPMCHSHHTKEGQFRLTIGFLLRERIFYFKAEKDFKEKYPRSTLV